jgi:hypothetical protein
MALESIFRTWRTILHRPKRGKNLTQGIFSQLLPLERGGNPQNPLSLRERVRACPVLDTGVRVG